MNDLYRKIGIVTIPRKMVLFQPEKVQLVYSNLIPIRVTERYDLAAYEVMAISEEFDIIDEGSIAPPYKAIFKEEDENTFVVFERE